MRRVHRFRYQERIEMKKRIAAVVATALVSVSGAAGCGAIQDEVQQRAEDEIQRGRTQIEQEVEQRIQQERTRAEQQIRESLQQTTQGG